MKFKEFYLAEAFEIDKDLSRKKANQEIAFFHGRFNPFHLGHRGIVEKLKAKSKLPVVIFIVKGKITSKDKTKNPLDFKTQKKLILKSAGSLVRDVIETPNGFIPQIVAQARDLGYEPRFVSAGPDRAEVYKKMIKSIDPKFNVDLKIVTVKDRFKSKSGVSVSGTKVREAIKNNDFQAFIDLTQGYTDQEFKMLRRKIK